MKPLLILLEEKCLKAIGSAFPSLLENGEKIPLEVAKSTQEKFGHYQCNSAMKLSKSLSMPPRAIGEKIAAALIEQNQDEPKLFSKIEVAGPGFINLTLSNEFLSKSVDALAKSFRLGIGFAKKKQKVVVDFSSPNIAKEMHVGHLRSTIIGDCLARVFEYFGHDVLRLNHLGDWGTAFGMLIAYLKKNHPEVLSGQEETTLSRLVAWYRESKALFDRDPEFKKESQLEVVALQGGEKQALKAWKIICEISSSAYQEIYDLLDIRIKERGESFYNPMLPFIVADLETKKLVTVSDGAKCLYLDGFIGREGEALPLIVQKSDGGYNYATTDMASIYHRTVDEKADRLIYVTDAGQALHFQMVFAAAEKAGYLDRSKVRVDHVPFGVVLGPDGKKFKTRSGETEKLIDLLQNGILHAEKILLEKDPDIGPDERKELAKTLGISAIKYSDLSCNRTHDYTFSYERMLKFDGNTAAFLLYAYVRVIGIKRKVNLDLADLSDPIILEHPSEIALAVHLLQFNDTLNAIAEDLMPNYLTEYLFTLAEKFNAFFRDCRVEGSNEQNSRLWLAEAAARTLKLGLNLLGIQPVERM